MNKKTIVLIVSLFVELAPKTTYAATRSADPLGNPVTAWIQIIVSLVLILVLAVFSIRFLARRANVSAKGSIRVLAARQVAPNRSVQVISVQNRKFLIGIGNEVTLLADVSEDYPDPDEGDPLQAEPDFSVVLAQKLQSVRNRYKVGNGRRRSDEDS